MQILLLIPVLLFFGAAQGTDTDYVVTVKTSSYTHRPYGNEYGEVYIKIHGTSGLTDRIPLNNPSRDEYFWNGTEKTVIATGKDVGTIRDVYLQRIELRITDRFIFSRWQVEWVRVQKAGAGEPITFEYNSNVPEGQMVIINSESALQHNLTGFYYDVTVKTSDAQGNVGTDGNVQIKIHGTSGDTEPITLDLPNYNDFEPGNTDKYTVTGRYVGNVTSVSLKREDPSGADDEWIVDWVTVWDLPRIVGEPITRYYHENVPVDQWVQINHVNGTTDYRVTITTVSFWSDYTTGGKVHIKIRGTRGETEPIALNEPSNDVQSGHEDTFTVRGRDVGAIRQVYLKHEIPSGSNGEWLVGEVTVQKPDGIITRLLYARVLPEGRWVEITLEKRRRDEDN